MLMACRNGHLEVVEYLYERCDADIEQPGSGIFVLMMNRATKCEIAFHHFPFHYISYPNVANFILFQLLVKLF